MTLPIPDSHVLIDTEFLRDHWQGHRRLTRRLIAAYRAGAVLRSRLTAFRPAWSRVPRAAAGDPTRPRRRTP